MKNMNNNEGRGREEKNKITCNNLVKTNLSEKKLHVII
jgi:hypothetical protein